MIIGIPVKDCLEELRHCLMSIFESTRFYDKIVLADSGSDDGTSEYCQRMSQFNENIIVINSRDDIVKSYNDLIDYALRDESDLLITQSDVVFPRLYARDWGAIYSSMAEKEQVGCLTTINGTGISGDDYLKGLEWVGQWFCYLPKRTLKKVGKFDEEYSRGFGADIDYTYRIMQSGLKILKLNYWVDHHMMGNRTDQTKQAEKEKQSASKRFKEKWQK